MECLCWRDHPTSTFHHPRLLQSQSKIQGLLCAPFQGTILSIILVASVTGLGKFPGSSLQVGVLEGAEDEGERGTGGTAPGMSPAHLAGPRLGLLCLQPLRLSQCLSVLGVLCSSWATVILEEESAVRSCSSSV